MFCPECECEFLPGVARCADCDVALVDRLPERTAGRAPGESPGVDLDGIPGVELDDAAAGDLVVVKTFENRIEADLARTALASAGIPYRFEGGELGSYGALTAFSGGVPILVRPEDAEDARAILEAPPEEEGAEDDTGEETD